MSAGSERGQRLSTEQETSEGPPSVCLRMLSLSEPAGVIPSGSTGGPVGRTTKAVAGSAPERRSAGESLKRARSSSSRRVTVE